MAHDSNTRLANEVVADARPPARKRGEEAPNGYAAAMPLLMQSANPVARRKQLINKRYVSLIRAHQEMWERGQGPAPSFREEGVVFPRKNLLETASLLLLQVDAKLQKKGGGGQLSIAELLTQADGVLDIYEQEKTRYLQRIARGQANASTSDTTFAQAAAQVAPQAASTTMHIGGMVVLPVAAADLVLSTALAEKPSVPPNPEADSELLPLQYRLVGGETVDVVNVLPEALMATPSIVANRVGMVADRAGEFAEQHPVLAFGAGMIAAAVGAEAYRLGIPQILVIKILDSLSKALTESALAQRLVKGASEGRIVDETRMWRNFQEGIRSGRIKPTEPKWSPEERLEYEIFQRRYEAKTWNVSTFGRWTGWCWRSRETAEI